MRCKICNSDQIQLLEVFKPYIDVDWTFNIYSCSNCKVRFALRDDTINYHELLHSLKQGRYENHYRLAENVKRLLSQNNISACEKYLMSIGGGTYAELITYIKQKGRFSDILELGCSSGFMSAFLRSKGYNIDGVDISSTAISYAKSTFGPFFYTEFPKKEYDIIIHKGLIGCVDDPKSFFSNCINLLKPNGEMFFNAPNVESPVKLKELWVSTPPPDLIYIYHQKTFDYMIDDNLEINFFKIKTKREIMMKNIKRLQRKKFNNFPIVINKESCSDQKKNHIRLTINRFIYFLGYLLSFTPIFRKFDDEYGLFVHVKKK